MNAYINNNGIILPKEQYTIKSGNRAYLYGDGLFESIRAIDGRAINVDNHVKRLLAGMKALKMEVPNHFNTAFFQREINNLLQKNDIIRGGRVRLSVDRRPGGNFGPTDNGVDYFIEVSRINENNFVLNEEGWKLDEYQEMRKDITPFSVFKTKNALIYVMAKIKAAELGLDDLLILNHKSGIIETASCNLFVVSNGVLYTPDLNQGCLAGTMRMQVINLSIANNIKVYECNISPQNLLVADEVFLTNAISGIIWVSKYRTKQYFPYISKELIHLLNNRHKNDT